MDILNELTLHKLTINELMEAFNISIKDAINLHAVIMDDHDLVLKNTRYTKGF